MLAVGEYLWGQAPDILLRASCAFGGGVGGCHSEMCGVLSAGVLLGSARYGRTSPDQDDKALYAWICDLRERFKSLAGATDCKTVRSRMPDVERRCRPLVEDGTRLIMERLLAYQG